MQATLIRRGLGLAGATAVALVMASGATAHASVTHRHLTPQPVVTESFTMTDHGDSGGAGNDWATLNFTRTLRVYRAGAGSYTATITDSGRFATIPGQLAPNQGGSQAGVREPARSIGGTFSGTLPGTASFFGPAQKVAATYSFTASTQPSSRFVTRTRISGTPTSGKDTTSLFYEQVFAPGTVFGGAGITNFGYAYTTSQGCLTLTAHRFVTLTPQRWADTQANGDGQLPADGQIAAFPAHCIPVG